MAGILNAVKDPLLKRMVVHIESRLTPELRKNYDAVVVSGMKLMFSEQTHQYMAEYLQMIKVPQDVPKMVAHGIIKLLSIIQNQSKQASPFPAAGPACMALACMALEFVEKRNKINVDNKIIDETMTLIKEGIFSLYKITPEVLEGLKKRPQGAAGAAQPPTAAPPAESAPVTEPQAEGPADVPAGV